MQQAAVNQQAKNVSAAQELTFTSQRKYCRQDVGSPSPHRRSIVGRTRAHLHLTAEVLSAGRALTFTSQRKYEGESTNNAFFFISSKVFDKKYPNIFSVMNDYISYALKYFVS